MFVTSPRPTCFQNRNSVAFFRFFPFYLVFSPFVVVQLLFGASVQTKQGKKKSLMPVCTVKSASLQNKTLAIVAAHLYFHDANVT